MKAEATSLLSLLKNSPQFVIPIYQRNYSWSSKQCERLWADMLRAGTNNNINAHFIGAITYIERDLRVLHQEPSLVIDGQQRLTTCTLLIAALADYFEENQIGELLGAFSAKKLRNYYLINPDEDGDRHFKLLLSETDKNTLLAILQKGSPMSANSSQRIKDNYKLFQDLISTPDPKNPGDGLEAICRGLAKLKIVAIALERSQDDPQMIFESMNSTGMKLKKADLIRNYVLMDMPPDLQIKLYKDFWQPMEKNFGQEAYDKHFDPFIRHYLVAKTGNIPNMEEVYDYFKDYALGKDVFELISDIRIYADYYCAMTLDAEQNSDLKIAFHDLKELKVDVAYPFLMDAYHHYKLNKLTLDELVQIVRLVESYVFRRAICSIPTNSLNKIFATFSRSLKNKDSYLESVKALFLLQPSPSYRSFPNDEEFQRDIKIRDLYNFGNRSYWLRRLENHNRKERVDITVYTIEHIMPQNKNLREEWKTELGSNWLHVQQTWLHTLGNLTLTGYNSKYSDNSFKFKQKQAIDDVGNKVGFDSSPLRLNTWKFDIDIMDEQTGIIEKQQFSLATIPTWNEIAIQARAERLALEATKVWSMPKLDSKVLEIYRNQTITEN